MHAENRGLSPVVPKEEAPGYENRRIDAVYLRETLDDFGQNFYLCGPPGFMDAVTASLKELGADPQALVFEE